jgi:hypothetical protein
VPRPFPRAPTLEDGTILGLITGGLPSAAALDRGRGWSLVHARHALAERRLQVGRPTMLLEEVAEGHRPVLGGSRNR